MSVKEKKELNTCGPDAMQMLGAALAATTTVPPLQEGNLFFHRDRPGLIPRQDEKDESTRNISTTTTIKATINAMIFLYCIKLKWTELCCAVLCPD
jgi:hypothetical protein